jgi:hypothetical protein
MKTFLIAALFATSALRWPDRPPWKKFCMVASMTWPKTVMTANATAAIAEAAVVAGVANRAAAKCARRRSHKVIQTRAGAAAVVVSGPHMTRRRRPRSRVQTAALAGAGAANAVAAM